MSLNYLCIDLEDATQDIYWYCSRARRSFNDFYKETVEASLDLVLANAENDNAQPFDSAAILSVPDTD